MSRFGELLRYYRTKCEDPQRGNRPLTQARLGQLVGEQMGLASGYTGAAVSDWERGESKISAEDRLLLITLISVLHRFGGLQAPIEADTFLMAGGFRPLDAPERQQIFPEDPPPQSKPDPESQLRLVILFLGELVFRPSTELQMLFAAAKAGPPPVWSRVLLLLLGWPFRRSSSHGVLHTILWVGLGMITWRLTFPLLHWPFVDSEMAGFAVLMYAGGTLVIPACVSVLVYLTGSSFWAEQHLKSQTGLWAFTHLGAAVGFHVGYMIVFSCALIGHYLGLNQFPFWFEGLAALGLLLITYASARQVPFNQWRAFGALQFTESDAMVMLVFSIFGILWGGFFYATYEWLLSPWLGGISILIAIGLSAGLNLWQRRSGLDRLPVQLWAFIGGSVIVLYQIGLGGLYPTTVSIGIVATVVALLAWKRIRYTWWGIVGFFLAAGLLWLCLKLNVWAGWFAAVTGGLAWWRWGKTYFWFPISFWIVVVATVAGQVAILWLGWPEWQASIALVCIVAVILYVEARRGRPYEMADATQR